MSQSETVIRKAIMWAISVGIFIALLLGISGGYNYINYIRNTGIDWEMRLGAKYLSTQAYHSSYVGGFYEQVGVANLKSEQMDKIISNAIEGRYEKSGGFSPNGAFFSAIKEAYPDITNAMGVFDKIVDYVRAGRSGYKAEQDGLLDMLQRYDAWVNKGIIQHFIIQKLLDMPSDKLQARIGDVTLKGQSALDQMYKIVLVEGTTEAFKTGKMKALSVKDVK